MKTLSLLLAGLGLALSFPLQRIQKAPAEGFRFLKIAEEKPAFWVPGEVVEILSQSHFNFMDVTEHQFVDLDLTPASSAIPSGPSHQDIVEPLISKIDMDAYLTNLESLTAFQNRYYSSHGAESAEWVFNKAQEYSNNRTDITVTQFKHTWAQPSTIARIEGSSSQELVILGAHQDSTAPGMPTGRSPGADDDGSGSAALLEILRLLVEADFKPEYSVEFHWYAAEEVGLLGSQGVADDYQKAGKAVRGMMQLDMIGYDQKEQAVGFVTDFTDATLNAFSRKLVDEYLNIGWKDTLCGYGCSDHASWNKYGYPSSFPFEAQFSNRSPFIHTSADTIENMSIEHAQEFVKLGLSFVVEMSHL